MIRIICGGVGSGKTSSAVHEIAQLNENVHVYANFNIDAKNLRCSYQRLKIEHIMQESYDEEHPKRKPKRSVNFDYWRTQLEAHENIAIYIDEAHNVMNSRRSMSSWNVIFSEWLVQIRKILGEHETNHLTLITQRVSAIDIVARELAMQIIAVQKLVRTDVERVKTRVRYRGRVSTKLLHPVAIVKHYFSGRYCLDKFGAYEMGQKSYDARSVVIVNPVFALYESYALVDFGSGVYV